MGGRRDDGETATLTLASALDSAAAAPLLESLQTLRGRALRLDGSGVERLGGLALQVLLAARAAWAADGTAFVLDRPSELLTRAFALMGATPLFATETTP